METKINKIADDIVEIKVTLARQSEILSQQKEILKEHMVRTKLSEQRLDKLELPYKIVCWLGVPLAFILTILQLISLIKAK